MKVAIHKNNQEGAVNYNPKTKAVVVTFPDAQVVRSVRSHLTRKRKFRIPESKRIDDYRVDNVKPTESTMYMNLALCTLWANTEVTVEWT